MKATLILLSFLFTYQSLLATDIYPSQSWELIKDLNSNGWADEGDIIRHRIDVSVYSEENEKLDISYEQSPGLQLITGSVRVGGGTVIDGNEPTDRSIKVIGLVANEPWDITTLIFDSRISNSSEVVEHIISSQAAVLHSSGTYLSNRVQIPILMAVTTASATFPNIFSDSARILLVLLIGLVAGVLSKRSSFLRISRSV